MSLANRGDLARAVQLIDFLAHDPHMSGFGKSLLEQLRRMQANRNEAAREH